MRISAENLPYIPWIALLPFLCCGLGIEDPCLLGNHNILSDTWRSVDNSAQGPNGSHCDNTIPVGWFRMRLGHKDAMMPTDCVEVERCGTLAPLWLSMDEKTPLKFGEERRATACATWRRRDKTQCCLFSKPVKVKNCGRFLLYQLRPPPGCDMAYCAKEIGAPNPTVRPECGKDEVFNEDEGKCDKAFNSVEQSSSLPLLDLPMLFPSATRGSVYMNCTSAILTPGDSRVRFKIYWYNKTTDRLNVVKVDISSSPSSLLEIGDVIIIGETVVCAMEAISLIGTNGGKSFSDPYFMGIRVPGDDITIYEDMVNTLTFTTTVPVICDRLRKHCRMNLVIERKAVSDEPPTTMSECVLEFRPALCDRSNCGNVSLKIKPWQDYTNNIARTITLHGMVESMSLRMWTGYRIPEVKLRVRNVPTTECYSFTDPHVITFDKRKYDLYRKGTFVLYKDTNEFEVHTRVWDCQNTVGYCHCGLVVRDRSDIISVDLCHGRVLPGKAEVKVPMGILGQGAMILEARGGSIITLLLRNGARIKTNVDYWGLSISLRVPGASFNRTLGLCGTFDDIADNDLHDTNGQALHGQNTEVMAAEFAELWRINAGESLFEKLPEFTDVDASGPNLATPTCQCLKSDHKFPFMDSCQDFGDIRDRLEILTYEDTTSEYVGMRQNNVPQFNPEYNGRRKRTVQQDTEENDLITQLEKTEYGNHVTNPQGQDYPPVTDQESFFPVFESLDFSKSLDDLFDNTLNNFGSGAYHFEADYNGSSEATSFPRWPTASGMTEGQAFSLCSDVILDSAIASYCGSNLREKINYAIDICVKDIQLKDDTAMISNAITLAENMCELAIIERSVTFAGGATIVSWPGGLRDLFNCPETCNGQGQCTPNGCVCDSGYLGADCGQKAVEFLLAADGTESLSVSIRNLTTCDRRTDDCTFVIIPIFLDTASNGRPKFQCKATPLHFSGEIWMPSVSGIATSTRLLPDGGVKCALPPGEIRRARIVGDKKSPIQAFSVEVTDKIGRTLDGRRVLVYDSLCQDCPESGTSGCTIKGDTCLINGVCYKNLGTNSRNSCQQCVAELNQFAWSKPKDNKPPVIHLPSEEVRIFAGDIVEHLLAATDPEGSQVALWVEDDDAVVQASGYFRWEPNIDELGPLPALKTFEITASDNCNDTVTSLLKILVMPCDCLNDGKCLKDEDLPHSNYLCLCAPGYTGNNCEAEIDECASNPCEQGRCVNRLNGYQCVCDLGFEGPSCGVTLDACKDDPCYEEVECVSEGGEYICGVCPEGMTGDGETCTDINDCTSRPCFPGATCQDLPAPARGHKCSSCPRYFVGDGERCVRTDTSACAEGACFIAATCEESHDYPGFYCGPCPYGFIGDGKNCTAQCSPPCGRNRRCVGPDQCRCREGYMGTRCNIPICRPHCLNKGVCYRPNECRCRPGYAGSQCEKAVCLPPCQHGGRCVGRNICSCPYGYMGRKCEAMACTLPCQNGGTCSGANKCICRHGYEGRYCERAACSPHCRNGGYCEKPRKCKCPPNYFGKSCERALCRPPCQNGGKCRRSDVCQCPRGFSGSKCQIAMCTSACMNGGRCIAPDKCACQSGYTGVNCHIAVCHLPCQNGGICFKPEICACSKGYRGANCARPICWPRCRFGGRCVKPNTCQCRQRFGGKYCQKLVRGR